MKILVTGGAGFIGSHLCEALIENNDEVICFDNFQGSEHSEWKNKNILSIRDSEKFRIYQGDIRQKMFVEVPFRCNKIHTVIHLAAQTGVRPSVQEPVLHYSTNVIGLVNVLQLCVKYGVKNLIFASSSSIYGDCPITPFTEDLKSDSPLSPYAATKKAGENACYVFHKLYGINIICLRPFTVYGPRQRKEMAISLFTHKIDSGEPVAIFGAPENSRDYTYVSDVVDGFLKAIHNNKGYEIYNIGCANPVTLNDLIKMIETELGKKAMIEHSPMQLGESHHTYADISKAQAMLGYSPIVGIQEGLKKYIKWYKDAL